MHFLMHGDNAGLANSTSAQMVLGTLCRSVFHSHFHDCRWSRPLHALCDCHPMGAIKNVSHGEFHLFLWREFRGERRPTALNFAGLHELDEMIGNVVRPDIAHLEISQGDGLKNAPKKDSDYFRVPKVIEQ